MTELRYFEIAVLLIQKPRKSDKMKALWLNLFGRPNSNEEVNICTPTVKHEPEIEIIEYFESLPSQYANAELNKNNNTIKIKQIKNYLDELTSQTNSNTQGEQNENDFEQMKSFIQFQQNQIKKENLKRKIEEKKRINEKLLSEIQKVQAQLSCDDETLKYQIRKLIQQKRTDYINKLSSAINLAYQEYNALTKLFDQKTAISRLEQKATDVPYHIRNESNVSKRIQQLAEFVNNG